MNIETALAAAKRLRPGLNWEQLGQGHRAIARGHFVSIVVGAQWSPLSSSSAVWAANLVSEDGATRIATPVRATTPEALFAVLDAVLAAWQRDFAAFRLAFADVEEPPAEPMVAVHCQAKKIADALQNVVDVALQARDEAAMDQPEQASEELQFVVEQLVAVTAEATRAHMLADRERLRREQEGEE